MDNLHKHFQGKNGISHVAEAQARGIISSVEIHGAEIPGHLSAAADAAKESSVVLVMMWALLMHLEIPIVMMWQVLGVFASGWFVWKIGRSAWLGWSRLERLHRVLKQEKWEIDHHREQERLELKALYKAKGFEGKMLDDVVDVLMADGNRLLKVMVEEELGLSLESQEHPLKQGGGAALGTVAATLLCGTGLIFFEGWGIIVAALAVIAAAVAISARYEQNRLVSAVVWNLGIAILAFATVYYLIQFFLEGVYKAT